MEGQACHQRLDVLLLAFGCLLDLRLQLAGKIPLEAFDHRQGVAIALEGLVAVGQVEEAVLRRVERDRALKVGACPREIVQVHEFQPRIEELLGFFLATREGRP